MANATTPVIQINEGNVGIGTTSPSQKLTLQNGTFQITGTSTFAGNVEIGRVGSDNNMAFATGGSERMRITSAGELQVTGNGVIKNEHSSANFSYWQQTSSDARLFTQYAQPLYFGTNASTKMTILSGGNVGIGTTDPIGKFNVSKDSTTDGLSQAITVSSSSVSTKRMNLGYVPGSNYAFIDVINYAISNTNQALSLQPNNGNVGIGETSPKAKLNVTGVSGGPTVPVANSSAGIVRI